MVNFLAACNRSRETAVGSILAFSRAMWQTHPARPGARRDEQALRRALAGEVTGGGANAIPALKLLIEHEDDPQAYCGIVMARRMLAPDVPPQDVQYFATRDIRRRGRLEYSAAAVQLVHSMAAALHRACEPHGRCELGELRRLLTEPSEVQSAKEGPGAGFAPILLELCAALGLMKPVTESSQVHFDAPVPADLLLSHLFGMPSGIAGLDVLFGGGGIMLIDAPPADGAGAAKFAGTVGGRTVLALGPFGSGKSLLSLQFAVEIARKGGIAWVMALEQPPEECLLSLEAIGTATHSPFFEVIQERKPWDAFRERTAAGGAIVFLPPNVSPYEQFLGAIQNKFNWLDKYPLRLVIIDPINSLMRSREKDAELRAKVVAFLQEAKNAGVNIWVNCERPETGEQESFEENISDTVLRLGVEWHGVYQKRNLQVIKSRLQRETTGKQAFFIRSGRGLCVYPSTATVEPQHSRWHATKTSVVRTGIPGFDEILGPDAVRAGDLLVFYGPTGTSKTLASLLFLHSGSADRPPDKRSMIVMDSEVEKLDQLVTMTDYRPPGSRHSVDVVRCSVLPGYIDPGHVIGRITDLLAGCQEEGHPVDRLVLGNLSRWMLGMPLLRSDPVFGVALLNILRRYAPTTIMLLDDPAGIENASFENYMIDTADSVLEFRRLYFRGEERHVVKALKTPAMAHRKEMFEIITDATGTRLQPTVSLLRLSPSGNVEPVKISLYLHSDTGNQKRYNQRLVGAVRASLSPHVRIKKQDLTYDPTVFSMMASSAVDELQVFQLDEFQMPSARPREGAPSRLVQFAKSQGEDLISNRLPRFQTNIQGVDDRTFVAVPFYDNISLLAYNRDYFKQTPFPESWDRLQKACLDWEAKHEDGLFFACHATPSDNFESYNCFFLEILRAIAADLNHESNTRSCDLLRWISHDKAVEAGTIFQTLCRRSHERTLAAEIERDKDNGQKASSPYEGALVGRHWYSTLNQMLADMGSSRAQAIAVRPLYQDTTTAGEWYLGIPVYSAAPETGLEVIRVLTAAHRELERLHLGVGMPTRTEFYYDAARRTSISPYFELSVETIAPIVQDRAFQRSKFFCYQLFGETLAAHLQRILTVPGSQDAVGRVFESLKADIEFIRLRRECQNCAGRPGNSSMPCS